MYLYIIRHAEAIERIPGGNDEIRALTSRGRDRFRRVGATLKNLGIVPDLIATSPLIRAVQTAEILASSISSTCEMIIVPDLAAGFSLPQLQDFLSSHANCRHVAIVGHEPALGLLTRELLGSAVILSFKKGATLCLELDPTHPPLAGNLQWLVSGRGKLVNSRKKALARLSINSDS
ncbi:MAG TPA: phosphohistidine phosphatase SixA [Geobacteraceae bacterium]|nr:phosphohistidine phosphatase SixA [Geobacteraceae bacterium]